MNLFLAEHLSRAIELLSEDLIRLAERVHEAADDELQAIEIKFGLITERLLQRACWETAVLMKDRCYPEQVLEMARNVDLAALKRFDLNRQALHDQLQHRRSGARSH